MHMRTLLAFPLLLATVSTAALAAATQDEADRVRTAMQVYLTAAPGVVDVRPDGDNYIMTLDATPLLAKIPQDSFTAKIDPVVLTLTPKGNGQWDVIQSGPWGMSWNAPGISSFDAKAASYEWNGVFDENIVAFLNGTYALKGITFTQVITDPASQTKTSSASSVESWSGTTTGTARADGAVDSQSTMSFSGVTTASTTELPAGMAASGPPMDYSANIAGGGYTSNIKGFKSKAILDLVAWFVARPSKELLIRDQAQLKDKLAAALPLWENLDSSGSYDNGTVTTALGQFGFGSAGGAVTLNGVTKDGLFREALSLTGFTIPPGIAPPWTEGLVPNTIKLDFAVSGFDLEAPVKMALAQVDFSKDPPLPPDAAMLYLPAFAPNNSVNVKLAEGEISSPTFKITYDSDMVVGFAGFPTGKATIRMTGMDAVLAKVQGAAATDPMAQQAMGGLVAAKGFGKAEADGSLVWVVDVAAPNKVMINGVDMSAFMGMPPAQ